MVARPLLPGGVSLSRMVPEARDIGLQGLHIAGGMKINSRTGGNEGQPAPARHVRCSGPHMPGRAGRGSFVTPSRPQGGRLEKPCGARTGSVAKSLGNSPVSVSRKATSAATS